MDEYPLHLEPPNYLAWRRQLVHDLGRVDIGNRSAHDRACLVFWVNTEMMLDWTRTPITDQVLLSWDDDEKEGVWVLEEPTKEIAQRLETLLCQFKHWHEALKECGAVHFDHWRDNAWSKAAAERNKVHFLPTKENDTPDPTAVTGKLPPLTKL